MNKRPIILVLVAVSLFLIATTIRSGWLYLVSSGLISLVVLGTVSGFRATRGLEIERDCPREVFEGDEFTVRLRIKNSGRARKYFVSVKDLQFIPSKREAGKEIRMSPGKIYQSPRPAVNGKRLKKSDLKREFTRTVGIEKLDPRESVSVKYKMEAARRGVYTGSRIEISSAGIFDSAEIKRSRELPSELIVYPKTCPMERFPFHVSDLASSVRPFESSRKGAGLDYFGVRDYAPGDSLRHIHWKSSAKKGKLIVREYQHEYQHSLGILLLLTRSRYGDLVNNSVEDGLRIAASIIRHLEMTGSTPWLAVREDGAMNIFEHSGPYELMKRLSLFCPPEIPDDDMRSILSEGLDFLYGAGVPLGPLLVVSNTAPGILSEELSGITEMEGNSIISVLDESYGGDRSLKRVGDDINSLKEVASRKRVNLFQHKSGEDIGACLKEPLNVIAA